MAQMEKEKDGPAQKNLKKGFEKFKDAQSRAKDLKHGAAEAQGMLQGGAAAKAGQMRQQAHTMIGELRAKVAGGEASWNGLKAIERRKMDDAVRLLQEAAQRGHKLAQLDYAQILENGEGVGRDLAEAIKFYTMAADQGLAEAQFKLGQLHDAGRGVAQSHEMAVLYLKQAAAQVTDTSLP